MKIYLAWHEYESDGCDHLKLFGVFSTYERAAAAVTARRNKPGFVEYPDGFEIAERVIDQDEEWMEGFIKWRDM